MKQQNKKKARSTCNSVFAVVPVAVLSRGGRGVDVDLRAVRDRVEQSVVAVGGRRVGGQLEREEASKVG